MEVDSVNGADYTIAELRLWLQSLGLQSAGTKSSLLVRLNEVPAEKRGECPMAAGGQADEITLINYEEDVVNDCPEKENECSKEKDERSKGKSAECSQENDREMQKEKECQVGKSGVQSNDRAGRQKPPEKLLGYDFAGVLKKELELIKREKELLRKENDLLKMIAETERRREGHTAGEEVICSQEQQENLAQVTNKIKVPFNILKDMIPEYEGDKFPEMWMSQFKNITTVYDVDENTLKTLLMCKLKGKAQTWLHTKPNLLNAATKDILNEMEEGFCKKENKLVMRRNFEACRWKYTETFSDYFNEKVMLSRKLGIDEDELIDHIIEGIPDTQLRVQASLQCYNSKSQLLQAFSKIELKRRFQGKTQQANEEKVEKFRCYNCNSVGHFAADCQKPKRQMGACYGCGSIEHRLAACPERKPAVQLLQDDEYNA